MATQRIKVDFKSLKFIINTKMPSTKADPTIYPQDIQCIIDPVGTQGGIFISNVEAARNPLTLMKNGIKAVLTAAANIELIHSKENVPYYKKVPGEDHEKFDISKYFDQSVIFMENALKSTNVLVHCMAGVSRSVSLVLAYLIKNKRMTYEQAYNLVKNRRKIIYPNDGFVRQLKAYEKDCNRQNNDLIGFKRYQSPTKNSIQISQQFRYILSKYESPSKNMTPPKYQAYDKRYNTIVESPSNANKKSQQYSPFTRRTQYSPLKPYNIYNSPTRKTLTADLTKKYSLNQKPSDNYDQIERKISNIRKKYSSKLNETSNPERTRSYLQNQKLLMQTKKYNEMSLYNQNRDSPTKLIRKPNSYYQPY